MLLTQLLGTRHSLVTLDDSKLRFFGIYLLL
jgi:hypothetical protein